MYDYDYYYEQEPSEIDALVEETVDKITDTILSKAKDEVDSQLQKAKKIQEQYDKDKRILNEIINRQNTHIKTLTDELSNLQKEYDKKRSEIPSLDFEIGEKVLEAEMQYEDGRLVCSTCNGEGKVKIQSTEYGEIETTCPHCKGNTYAGEKNIVKEIKYRRYRPRTVTIVRANVCFENNGKLTTTYYTKEHSGSCEIGHTNIEKKIFKAHETEACRKYCDELNKKALEEAQKHIYKNN